MQKISLITCLALMYLTSSCQKKGEDCIYLIPQNYEGNILVVFDQTDGLDTIYEGKSRIYNIDTSGIFRTKFKSNYGIQRNFYFYTDSLGNRRDIKYATASSSNPANEVFAFNKETGKDYDKKKSADRDFEMITISKQKNIDSIGNLRSPFMWSKLAQME